MMNHPEKDTADVKARLASLTERGKIYDCRLSLNKTGSRLEERRGTPMMGELQHIHLSLRE